MKQRDLQKRKKNHKNKNIGEKHMKFDDATAQDLERIDKLAKKTLSVYERKPYYDLLIHVFCMAYISGSNDARVSYIKDICAEISEIAKAAGIVDDEIDDKDLN
jgi:uncharacterized protein (DUF1919 family)